MKAILTLFWVSVMFWGVIGDSQETAVCPLFEQDSKACAWIPSCVLPECNTQCVANVLGENQILHNLESVYATAMLCTAVSASVKAAATGMPDRRLQPTQAGILKILNDFKNFLTLSTTSRAMLPTIDASCASSAEVDAAEDALAMLADLAEGIAQDVTAGDAERAIMDIIIPLYKDAGKLKDWLSSKCSTATVAGDHVAMFWDMLDLESGDMPSSMAVCQASAEKIRTLVTQINDIMDEGGACAGAFASIESGICIGMDAGLMSDSCLNSLAAILNLDAVDVTKATSSWTTIHKACIAITDATECQAKAMDAILQDANGAGANMGDDASRTAAALAGDLSGTHAMTKRCTVAIALSLVAVLL